MKKNILSIYGKHRILSIIMVISLLFVTSTAIVAQTGIVFAEVNQNTCIYCGNCFSNYDCFYDGGTTSIPRNPIMEPSIGDAIQAAEECPTASIMLIFN